MGNENLDDPPLTIDKGILASGREITLHRNKKRHKNRKGIVLSSLFYSTARPCSTCISPTFIHLGSISLNLTK